MFYGEISKLDEVDSILMRSINLRAESATFVVSSDMMVMLTTDHMTDHNTQGHPGQRSEYAWGGKVRGQGARQAAVVTPT